MRQHQSAHRFGPSHRLKCLFVSCFECLRALPIFSQGAAILRPSTPQIPYRRTQYPQQFEISRSVNDYHRLKLRSSFDYALRRAQGATQDKPLRLCSGQAPSGTGLCIGIQCLWARSRFRQGFQSPASLISICLPSKQRFTSDSSSCIIVADKHQHGLETSNLHHHRGQ